MPGVSDLHFRTSFCLSVLVARKGTGEDTQGKKLMEVNHWCIHVVCLVVPSLLMHLPCVNIPEWLLSLAMHWY
jgi:hypothetical protein